jgi:hypothetical protein
MLHLLQTPGITDRRACRAAKEAVEETMRLLPAASPFKFTPSPKPSSLEEIKFKS